MLKLIQNEWMKIWAKKGTWILVVLMLVVLLIPGFVMKSTENIEDEDWRVEVENQIKHYVQIKASDQRAGYDTAWIDDELQKLDYHLENDVPYTNNQTVLSFIQFSVELSLIVTLIAVIIGAGIVSNEFSTGTIKMLLTRPVSRAKVLMSKLLTVFIFGLVLYVINIITATIFGFMMFNAEPSVKLVIENGVVEEVGMVGNTLTLFALSFGQFIISILFAFMMGSVFRSSSLAIGITVVLMVMGDLVVAIFSRFDFVKYIWLTHADLKRYAYGSEMVQGITLPMSIIVLAVYAFIFLLISFWSFSKRDVTA